MTGHRRAGTKVAVIGLGYAGLTVACVLAQEGYDVEGVEVDGEQLAAIRARRPRIFEPGLEDALRTHLDHNLVVAEHLLGSRYDAILVAVGTPVTAGREPDLTALEEAIESIVPCVDESTLVVIRSTVPVGTTRRVVLSRLERAVSDPLVAFCPERTIQGQALAEIRSLPQLIGGCTEAAARRAEDLFAGVARRCVRLSGPETAEMAKLVNNAHTDLLYAFANETALIAERHGLDPTEVVHGCNFEYPRPAVALPGFVGGGCLSKDPYLLDAGHPDLSTPTLARMARRVNEALPGHVARTLAATLRQLDKDPAEARITLCGLAYKGVPPTDDLRGAPVVPFLEALGPRRRAVLGHDFLVPDARLAELGVEPTSIAKGFRDADAVVFLNNHRGYRDLADELPGLCATASAPLVLLDCWRIFDLARAGAAGVAIERGLVGPSKFAAGPTRTFPLDPRSLPDVIYQGIAYSPCELSSRVALVS